MRPTKYRCYDRKEQRMFMVESMTWDYPLMVLSELEIADGSSGGYYDSWEVTPNERIPGKINRFEMMQYTGLKNKIGVEVYEGDIYAHNVQDYVAGYPREINYTNPVVYEMGAFWVGDILLIDAIENDSESEVIGNIYENPELLEVQA